MQTLEILEIAECPATLCNPLHTKKYVVPIYQRLFVWGEVQIKTLLNDLKAAMETSVPYYIGVITVVEKNNHWEIVDGQQRLTFLTLFGCECVRRGWDLQHDWKSFIYYSDTDSVSGKSQSLRIHYFGRENDESDIKNMLSEANIANVQNSNFRLFHDCFESVMRSFESNEKKKQQLIQYVFQQASFLISTLPSTYSPLDLNLFFEKMNAAGCQLEPVEIIKGKYFAAYAATWDACLNFDNKFIDASPDSKEEGKEQSIWEIINDKMSQVAEEPNNVQEVSYNRLVVKPSVYLLHVLRLCTTNEVSLDPSRLIKSFEKYIQHVDRKAFIDKMKVYRLWLDQNIIYLKPSANGSFEYLFRDEQREVAEDIQRANSKVAVVVSNDRMMKQFQSMLYVSSSDFQEWVLAMFEECKNGNEKLDLRRLKQWDNTQHPYSSPSWDYWAINRYWFWKLDYVLWEKVYTDEDFVRDLNSQEKEVIKKYVFRRNRSIEHLHPQTSSVAWGDEALHGFGNLALISAGFNSQQSNDTVGTKFGRMTDKINVGELESIKLLLMFKKAEGMEKKWIPVVAQKHAEEMHTILENYYRENLR